MKRPDGWDELYLEAYRREHTSGKLYGSPERAMFEAGADALYEGLIKIDTYVQVKEDGELLVSPAFSPSDWKKYRLVFIEEVE